jgi:hypothetical protein
VFFVIVLSSNYSETLSAFEKPCGFYLRQAREDHRQNVIGEMVHPLRRRIDSLPTGRAVGHHDGVPALRDGRRIAPTKKGCLFRRLLEG